MRRIACRSLAGLPLAAFAFVLLAQSSLNPVKPGNRTPHPSEPYTAEFKITHVQTLANGTTITRDTTEIEARDSQGRSLRSTTDQTAEMGGAAETRVNVNDPMGGTQSNWDTRTMKAHVTKMPPQDQRQGCWATDSGNFRISRYEGPRPGAPAPNGTPLPGGGTLVPAQRNKPEIEDLGESSIQGISVHGHRLITTIPAGQIGNNQPIVTTSENWSSAEFGLTLRDIVDDPRSGKRTRELVNLTPGEPDPTVFQIPDGYEVTTQEMHPVSCPAPR
jgi:hypothetical protein